MDSRTQERVEEWDSRPFNGGFDGLSDLAAGDFSGAVSTAGTWLFMLNGRIVGVIDGDIEDFETASGTQYEAPHPSLPLLYTMEERSGEARAKYYTNETPLREVDSTLQSGSFTGYVELSENVLSGDYYAVYYGGRRMAAAYIGNAERLLTGDEAFERAADEVGIYTVTDVEIDVIDVPGTADEPDSGSATESTTGSEPSDSAVDIGAADSSPAADSTSDPTADATSHSVDPIDISSTDAVDTDDATGSDPIEDSTVDDEPSLSSEIDLTADPTGITTTDESEAKQESATAGITESELSVDSESDPSPDETDADDERGLSEQDVATEIESTEYVDPDAAPVEPTVPDPEAKSEAESASEPTPAEPGVEESLADESASSPDLAEVEAAAEELDQNDISWVDEDDGADEDEDEGAGNGDDETTVAESSSDKPATEATEANADDGLEEQFEREEEWRETRRIPSIDPKNSEATVDASAGARETKSARSSTVQSSPSTDASSADTPSSDARADSQTSEETETSTAATATAAASDSHGDRSQDTESGSAAGAAADATDAQSERVAALTEKLEALQEQRDALVTTANELEAERDRLRSENEELSGTVERLQSRIADLETELERAREREAGDAAAGAGASAGTQLSPQKALSGTNLFVRYGSKSQPTLETAHDGNADRNEVASNLRLEHHTGFDSSDAVVDGAPYEEFLTSTMEHRFVNWLTEILLYEIRDTGNADGLGDLYDAIPRIDRAELGATISLADDETEDVPDQVTFDIVAFDKMGNPLVLVTLNDSREPATQELLGELEEAASAVKANYPDLAAAIAVTSSYFEPGALEVAEQATSGGFLSRGSKLSYVNLSRKDGYHLCLVESRSEGFHMNVPEL